MGRNQKCDIFTHLPLYFGLFRESGLKVKEYEPQRWNFSEAGCLGFAIHEHIDLGTKCKSRVGIYHKVIKEEKRLLHLLRHVEEDRGDPGLDSNLAVATDGMVNCRRLQLMMYNDMFHIMFNWWFDNVDNLWSTSSTWSTSGCCRELK
ncbi:hypothetical protein GUJ93_ZPchr0012g19513 [Zizania palustris]|uniref:Uncharacterized protein n=1 Tax=Zizania palustris TaxID=103762 RepID=A0A8J5WLP5_ZIZPA|nr:hypothetical protein GUJ93_ZPchr0012g19513 [Zizania palustris]